MRNKVDVLAVMELAYRHLNGGTDSLSTAEFVAAHAGMKEVRAAVAELIEAADGYAEAEAALANWELSGINAESQEKLQRRVHSARERLDAALAGVKGE